MGDGRTGSAEQSGSGSGMAHKTMLQHTTCNMQHTTCSGMDYLDLTLQRLMQLHKLAEAAAAKRNQHVAAARARARGRSATTCGPLQHVVATTCGPLQHVVRYNMKWSATTRGAARAVDLLTSEAASGGIAEEYVASFGRLMSLQAGACLLTQ